MIVMNPACRYNELILAGTVKTNLPPLRLAPAYLNAQDDAVTRRFQV